MCEQLRLFAEMKYSVASRKLWNFQTLKPPDTHSWVVPSPRFKFRNRDLRCTIHRNKPRLQYISLGCRFGHFLFLCFFWSLLLSVAICWIVIHGKSSDLFSEKSIHGPTTFQKLALSHLWHFQGRKVVPSTVKPVQNEIKTRFIHARSRKLAPACLFRESRRGSKLMRYSNPSSALAPLKWIN